MMAKEDDELYLILALLSQRLISKFLIYTEHSMKCISVYFLHSKDKKNH